MKVIVHMVNGESVTVKGSEKTELTSTEAATSFFHEMLNIGENGSLRLENYIFRNQEISCIEFQNEEE